MDLAQRISGKFYCAACSRFLLSQAELPMPESLRTPDAENLSAKRAPNSVKWWDAEARTWRWVSKNGRKRAAERMARETLSLRERFSAAMRDLWPNITSLQ